MIVGEVALAVVLLSLGPACFVASFMRLMRVELGFDYRNVLATSTLPAHRPFRASGSRERERMRGPMRYLTSAIERLRAVAWCQVPAAALSGGLPLTASCEHDTPWKREAATSGTTIWLTSGRPRTDYVERDAPGPPAGALARANRTLVAPERVVVLNDVAARRYLGSEQAVGADVTFQLKTWKVVGVVKGLRFGGPESDVRPEAYVPVGQSQVIGGHVVVRTGDQPVATIAALKEAVRTVNPQSVPDVEALDDLFSGLIATRRFNMLLLSMFGLLAVAIATIGVYGVMAFLVAHRTQEIAVRMALGADAPTVLRSVLSQASRYLGQDSHSGSRRVQPRRARRRVPLPGAAR